MIACLLLPLLWLAVEAAGQPARPEPPAPLKPGEALNTDPLVDEARRVAGVIERLRQSRFTRLPQAVRVADDMREATAEGRAAAWLPAGRVAARGRAWADLGLGDEGSPRRLLRALSGDVQGVTLDPQGERILIAPNRLTDDDFGDLTGTSDPSPILLHTGVRPDAPLLAHALAHVLQRERAGREAAPQTTDGLLAALAWAEGEANLLALHVLFEGMGLGAEVTRRGLLPGAVLDGALLPPEMGRIGDLEQQLLSFVYDEGFVQAAARVGLGGFRELDAAAARRRTTRDVLHPQAAALAPEAFPEAAVPRGLRLADVDSLGEQGIVVLISIATGKDNLGLIAGDGWRGDRVLRFEPAVAADATVTAMTDWTTAWSSEAEAADFEYAFGRALAGRFPGAALVDDGGAGRRVLRAGGRVFRVERVAARVRIVVTPG